MVNMNLMEGIEGQTYTIIPMILAEVYHALDQCKNGFGHFDGSNLLLKFEYWNTFRVVIIARSFYEGH